MESRMEEVLGLTQVANLLLARFLSVEKVGSTPTRLRITTEDYVLTVAPTSQQERRDGNFVVFYAPAFVLDPLYEPQRRYFSAEACATETYEWLKVRGQTS